MKWSFGHSMIAAASCVVLFFSIGEGTNYINTGRLFQTSQSVGKLLNKTQLMRGEESISDLSLVPLPSENETQSQRDRGSLTQNISDLWHTSTSSEKGDTGQNGTRNVPVLEKSTVLSDESNSTILIPASPDLDAIALVNDSIVLGPNETSPLDNCTPTAQYRLRMTSGPYWTLHALDATGQPKTVGGDEFYIYFKEYGDPNMKKDNHLLDMMLPPMAVALPTDLGNGTYLLDFTIPPMRTRGVYNSTNRGRLTVAFEYTCSIGRIARPGKQLWKNNAAMRAVHQVEDVPVPVMRNFSFPSEDKIDLSVYDTVVCFGDSIMNNFCGMWWSKFTFRRNNTVCGGNTNLPLKTRTMNRTLELLNLWHNESLANATTTDARVALILGSAAWDVMESKANHDLNQNFDDHIKACRNLIGIVRDLYPNVTIYWKSPQAFHVQGLKPHCYQKAKCVERTTYMSASLSRFLHVRQKELMKELGVPLIDVQEASYLSASELMEGDGRHYRVGFNYRMLNSVYHSIPA